MRALRLVFVVLLTVTSGAFAVLADGGGAGGATAPNCGGQLVARPGGGYLTCTFDEEFNGSTLDTNKWYAMQGVDFHSGIECFVPSAETIGVANGALRLTINRAARAFRCGNRTTRFYSGMVTSAGHFGQAYGRFDIRAMLPTGPALQSALWLYPLHTIGPWPTSGEIDIAELFGLYPGQVLPHLHYLAPNGRKAPGTWCDIANAGTTYHTYSVEWTPTSFRFLYDGQTCFTFSGWIPHRPQLNPAPFDKPFSINLTLAMAKAQRFGSVAHTAWPSSLYVDYVRVWK
jgi:beta-glucanase (GH16 family)